MSKAKIHSIELEILNLLINNITLIKEEPLLSIDSFQINEHKFIYTFLNKCIIELEDYSPITIFEHFIFIGKQCLVDFFINGNDEELKDELLNHLIWLSNLPLSNSTLEELLSDICKIESCEYEKKQDCSLEEAALLEDIFEEVIDELIYSDEVLKTGFDKVDDYIGGLKPENIYVLGGEPGIGKTIISIQIALNILRQGYGVGYFSLEMGKNRITKSIISMICGADSLKNLSFIKVQKMKADIKNMPLYIFGKTNNIDDILNSSKSLLENNHISIIFIDFLQLVKGGKSFSIKTEEVSSVLQSLSSLSKEFHIPIFINSSVLIKSLYNNGKEGKPGLASLKDSSDIGYLADYVMLLSKPKTAKSGIVEVYFRKNRSSDPIPDQSIYLEFDKTYLRFVECKKKPMQITNSTKSRKTKDYFNE